MVVDPRRDHRIAIPNPEQSEALHSPNACASCHLARPLPKAPKSDSFVSPIRQSDLASDDLLIKLGGIQQTMNLPPAQREPLLAPLKDHPSRAIRLTVAPLIGGSPEYREWLAHDADRAESLVALAALQSPAEARATFEKALQRDPTSLLAYLNYADFHRAQGSDAAAEPLLRKALDMYPDSASAHHTLGLLLVRQKRADAAVPELGRAADLAPNDSGYVYIYAVALYTTGKTDEALATLARARAKFPSNEAIQSAISAYCEDQRSRGRSHSTCR
jgi:tetratricopeptide (TPR) repeat protein